MKTGNKQGLKVSYDEGRAIHISPESCMHGNFLRGNREALYLTLSEIAIRYALKILQGVKQ
jgi:hypothetical protein